MPSESTVALASLRWTFWAETAIQISAQNVQLSQPSPPKLRPGPTASSF